MKQLKKARKRDHYTYTQLRRGERAMIYLECKGPVESFLVFRIKTKGERRIKDKVIPASEIWPSPSDFGVWAWYRPSYKTAIEKFNEIENKYNQKLVTQ